MDMLDKAICFCRAGHSAVGLLARLQNVFVIIMKRTTTIYFNFMGCFT